MRHGTDVWRVWLLAPTWHLKAHNISQMMTVPIAATWEETIHLLLREFARQLTSSWLPTRAEGRVWAALLGQDPANPVNSANPRNPLIPVFQKICLGATLPHCWPIFVKSDPLAQCDSQSALGVSPHHPNATQGDPK